MSATELLIVLCAAGLLACGGPSKPAAVAESDPWADYKGTFAGPIAKAEPKASKPTATRSKMKVASTAPSSDSAPATDDAHASSSTSPPAAAAKADTTPAPKAKAKKAKSGTKKTARKKTASAAPAN